VTADSSMSRTPVEAALRHLGARRRGDLVEIIEHAIHRPHGRTGTILWPLTAPTSALRDWTPSERAHAVWRVIEEGIVQPQVGPTAQSRRRRVLQAAFRLPDEEISEEWGASLTDRFKQLMKLRAVFNGATTTQPMEIAWKQGVERLAEYVEEQLGALRTPEDWARYRQVRPESVQRKSRPTIFRPPPEGAQKLSVNLQIMTVIMNGRSAVRRISERIISSQDDEGLAYYRTWAFASRSDNQDLTYVPTQALWGCRAQQVVDNGLPMTRLWFPGPLRTGEQAHFVSEAVFEVDDNDSQGWIDVKVDHHGIDPGELCGVLPVSGLTIRIRFDSRCLPSAVWWYAEKDERERYVEPSVGSPHRLDVVYGDVVKMFDQPCQPNGNYGIAYTWFPEEDRAEKKMRGRL
jgi:hypothetical protein